jgi:tetratricopeptide (TPR) repeat protein
MLVVFESTAQHTNSEIYDAGYLDYIDSNYEEAISLFNKLEIIYQDSIEYHLIIGICYSEIGDNVLAIESYNRCLNIDTAFDQAYIQRGISYFSSGKNALAISDFKSAILINPDNPEVYLNMGTVMFDSGDQDGACKQWNKANELGLQVANQMINELCK